MALHSVQELADQIKGSVKGNPEKMISGVASLRLATPDDISFVVNAKYLTTLRESKTGAALVPEDWAFEPEEGQSLILCADPNKAFTKICALYAPEEIHYDMTIDSTAYVHPTAKIAPNVYIGPNAVIQEGAEIAEGAQIRGGAYIGHFSRIGEKTIINPNVSVMHRCIIGKRCIIHAGTSIGADGFGYTPSFKGLIKIPQNGIVQIDDDVEIGANCTIDRARFGKTWIKRGVKIDNLVHVAHNVVIGESSVLIGQCGIAGSAELGRGVVVSAQAGVNGHITLGDGSSVAGTSAAQRSVPPGMTVYGTPGESQEDFVERHMLPRKFKKLLARVEALEAKLKEKEQN